LELRHLRMKALLPQHAAQGLLAPGYQRQNIF
jgi:hypothetical protein